MTRTIRLQSILPAAIVATLALADPGESLAQDQTVQGTVSLGSAIDEARHSPFHSGLRPTPLAATREEFGQVPRALVSQTFSLERGDLAPKVLFYTLPVIVALDAVFIYPMTQTDEGRDRGKGDFSAMRALGAIMAPSARIALKSPLWDRRSSPVSPGHACRSRSWGRHSGSPVSRWLP